MIRRYTDDVLTSIPAAPVHRPLTLTPHQSYTPLPIDGRAVRRAIRLAMGSAICWVRRDHVWECHVTIRSNWTGSDYTKITYRDRRRHCPRCDRTQTRELHGTWIDAN